MGVTLLPSLHLDAGTCFCTYHLPIFSHWSGQKPWTGLFSPPPITYSVLSLDLASDWGCCCKTWPPRPSVGCSLSLRHLQRGARQGKSSIFNIPRNQKHRRLGPGLAASHVSFPDSLLARMRDLPFSMLPASLRFSPLGSWLRPPGQTVGWWMQMTPWR